MRGVEGSIVIAKVMDERSAAFGYDAQANEYCDMFEKGIIDPAKTVRIALQDGASIASLIIMTEAGVAEASKKEAGQPDHNHRGMGRHDVMARIEHL
jgi:chaperonin GroEL